MSQGAPVERKIETPIDVTLIRRAAREFAANRGLTNDGIEAVAIAVSELATNLVFHARGGSIVLDVATGSSGRCGIRVESRDAGPGIVDVDLAMQDGFSTRGGYGSGLPAVRRLMDDFDLITGPNGTTVVATKWA